MERIGVINRQVLDSSESEAVIQSSKRPRLVPQATMQGATRTGLVEGQGKVVYQQ